MLLPPRHRIGLIVIVIASLIELDPLKLVSLVALTFHSFRREQQLQYILGLFKLSLSLSFLLLHQRFNLLADLSSLFRLFQTLVGQGKCAYSDLQPPRSNEYLNPRHFR